MHSLSKFQQIAIGTAVIAGFWIGLQWFNQPASTNFAAQPTVTKSLTPKLLVVDVVGAVHSPGVVELEYGARVRDAVAAAGGLLPHQTAGVNLARILQDGEQIIVGTQSAASAGLVNLNTADTSTLEALPGIGPVLAGRLIEYRSSHGGFRDWKAVDQVSGVGPSLLADLKRLVSLG